MSEGVLSGLEPALVWSHFEALTRIPRPSKHEEEARAHVLAWAAAKGFGSKEDKAGNVVVEVPASPTREGAPTMVLQGHLDIVCERDPESPFDPREGRIDLVIDGDWVAANGTTLGADDGIGVAAALAAAEDPGVAHGPLELLFTVSEEQGLTGAKELDPELVSGRRLLNLDGGDEEGTITVGCAGSIHTFTRLPLKLEPTQAGQVALEVHVSGARGGHSGGDIARGRVNAINALGRVLLRARESSPFRLSLLDGGVSRNAIPRAARAVVTLEPSTEVAFRTAAESELAALREQYAGSDDGLVLEIERGEAPESAAESTTWQALDLLAILRSGVVAMNPELPDVVETSASLNVAGTRDGVLTFASMVRSSNAHALDDVAGSIESAARLAGADVEVVRSYPPWRPDLDSRFLASAKETFAHLFGVEPGLRIVHGGLECAVIGEKVPGIEMIAIGPEIEGPHAPGERVSISSTERFYRLLTAVLDDLSREVRG